VKGVACDHLAQVSICSDEYRDRFPELTLECVFQRRGDELRRGIRLKEDVPTLFITGDFGESTFHEELAYLLHLQPIISEDVYPSDECNIQDHVHYRNHSRLSHDII
jgi:hypothetical protein